jgi:hypothetical protein
MCICHKPSLGISLKLNLFSSSRGRSSISKCNRIAVNGYANLTCSFVDQCWPGFREDCMKTATKFHLAKQEWSSKFNPQSYWLIHKETNLTCHDISKTNCACRSSLYCSLFNLTIWEKLDVFLYTRIWRTNPSIQIWSSLASKWLH